MTKVQVVTPTGVCYVEPTVVHLLNRKGGTTTACDIPYVVHKPNAKAYTLCEACRLAVMKAL